VCDALLPDYVFSLGWDHRDGPQPESLPIIPVRHGVPDYAGPMLPWPPGWTRMWSTTRTDLVVRTIRADAPFDADR
jgi:hypothetical protein